jgi:hypothetical protein
VSHVRFYQTTELLLIGGRSGVGKSAVGNELHHLLVEREVMHRFIEGDNLDLAYPPPWEYGLAEANLSVMWRNYQALGHHRLIYANTFSVLCSDQLVAAIDGASPVSYSPPPTIRFVAVYPHERSDPHLSYTYGAAKSERPSWTGTAPTGSTGSLQTTGR